MYPTDSLIRTAEGCSCAMRANAVSRQVEHSSSMRFNAELYTSTRAAGHEDLSIVIRCQPSLRAIGSSPGNQLSACESPNNTTVFSDAWFPNSHSIRRASPGWPMQLAFSKGEISPGANRNQLCPVEARDRSD